MRIHNKYKHALDELVTRVLDTRRGADDAAALAFDPFALDQVVSVLETAIDFPPEIPEVERRPLIYTAALGVLGRDPKQGVVGSAALLEEIRAAESRYLRQPLRKLVVVASLGVHHHEGLRSARVCGSTIQFSPGLPGRFDRAPVAERIAHLFPHGYREYVMARIPVESRTPRAAVDQGLYRLDLLRAYWNFALNWLTVSRETSGERRPVNAILPGPLITVHTSAGELVDDEFWYESQPIAWHWVLNFGNRWTPVERFRAQMLRWERRVPYADAMRDVLVRYVRALDTVHYDVAYNRLWAVLERLLGFGVNASHGELIERLRFLYPAQDQVFVAALLEHLRDVRNGLVHDDRARARMETYLFQLKRCIERVVWYYMREGHYFTSFTDAAAFLDHPRDLAELKRQARTLGRAVRMQTRAARPPSGNAPTPEEERVEELPDEVPDATAQDAAV